MRSCAPEVLCIVSGIILFVGCQSCYSMEEDYDKEYHIYFNDLMQLQMAGEHENDQESSQDSLTIFKKLEKERTSLELCDKLLDLDIKQATTDHDEQAINKFNKAKIDCNSALNNVILVLELNKRLSEQK